MINDIINLFILNQGMNKYTLYRHHVIKGLGALGFIHTIGPNIQKYQNSSTYEWMMLNQ